MPGEEGHGRVDSMMELSFVKDLMVTPLSFKTSTFPGCAIAIFAFTKRQTQKKKKVIFFTSPNYNKDN